MSLGLTTGLLLASCTGPPPPACDDASALRYAGPPDSLGLAAFDSLDAPTVRDRRRLADVCRPQAAPDRSVVQRLRGLNRIVGLVPDEPASWLRLAELRRRIGDREGARQALLQVLRTLRRAPAAERADLHLGAALLQAWLHYDLGDWVRGLAWAERAEALSPAERRSMLIRGLLLAGAERSLDATALAAEIERIDYFRTDWRWVRGMTEFFQDRPKGAARHLLDMRPDPLHRPEYWRDLGLIHESLRDWRLARRAHREALRALPAALRGCLREHERRAPGVTADAEPLPCWLTFDRYFALGSPTAFAVLAEERFAAAAAPAGRERWAEAAVAAASMLIRRHLHVTWAHALRGRVYAEIGLPELARPDLEKAVAGYQAQGRIEPATFYRAGRLLLEEEKYAAARPLLAASVTVDSTRARAWSDLGLALIMTDGAAEAEAALDRALELDPGLAVAWYNRGLMHFHAERWGAAARDLERAAELAPDNPEIPQILQRARLLEQREGPRSDDDSP